MTMTVAELIAKLKEYSPGLEVKAEGFAWPEPVADVEFTHPDEYPDECEDFILLSV